MGALKNYKKYKTEVEGDDKSNSIEDKKRIHSLKEKISNKLESDVELQKKAASLIINLMNQK